MQPATITTSRWQAIEGTTGITMYRLKAKRLRNANAMPAPIDAIDAIRAHSRNFSTPIARLVASAVRTSNENPPANPMPVSAIETRSPASPPVVAMTATKKKAKEPKARIAAPKNVNTATAVTPMGRFTFLPFRTYFGRERTAVTPQFDTPQAHS
jgi:hypothetical protein